MKWLTYFVMIAFCSGLACRGNRREVIRYASPAGVSLELRPDSSFTYLFKGAGFSDSAEGSFVYKDDTLNFDYHKNETDTIASTYKGIGSFKAIGLVFSFNSLLFRPARLYKSKKRLYYIDNISGRIMKRTINGISEEMYLQLVE